MYRYAYATSQAKDFVIVDTDSLAHAKAIATLHRKRQGALCAYVAEVDDAWDEAELAFFPCYARWLYDSRTPEKGWQEFESCYEMSMRRFEERKAAERGAGRSV